MRKLLFTAFLFSACIITHAKSWHGASDSLSKKVQLHVAISIKPLINRISPIDSESAFFYSKTLLEPQISYQDHWFVFGFSINSKTNPYTINGIPCEYQKTSYSLSPAYLYRFYNAKNFEVKGGASYLRTVKFSEDRKFTSLETITETTKNTENGLGLAFRFTYKFIKLFSVELEMATYAIKTQYHYKMNYPLTPSLGL